MKRWFLRLPIHHKLVALALVVTTAALTLATVGLIALDLWRYRATAQDDTRALAAVIAENTAAAVTFKDVDAARDSLATVRVRLAVQRACLYLPDGSLFAGFARRPELVCPGAQPLNHHWRVVSGSAPITRNNRDIGAVYVERDLAEIGARVAVAALTGFGMLLLAATAASALAHRLHRGVSTPITQLAVAARALDPEGDARALPDLQAGDDEIGDLVRAFTDMLRRVREANARLVESNQRLTRQEAEREDLLLREREASRLKDEFLAAVSHELRTPLNAIAGWVQILTSTVANEQMTAKAVASIARNARAQTRVIEDLVDVSRIATGKLTLRFEPVDLREVAGDAVDAIRSSADAKNISLKADVPVDACFVHGDRDRLQQVVWNLLSNAVKFTPVGGVVSLALNCEHRAFTVQVSDTGVGIPESFLPHVFDRFRQADGSITREYGGLGLGLAIVKELAEQHGGAVTASSGGPGQGATFTVRLPLSRPGHVSEPSATPPATVPGELAGVRILAVDDNADALEVLAASLAISGADVRVATSGEEALRTWESEPADVLICDLAMPVTDGFEVLRRLRERDALSGRVTRTIAVTAHASDEYRARTGAAGFDFHIAKPYDAAELMRIVRAAMDKV